MYVSRSEAMIALMVSLRLEEAPDVLHGVCVIGVARCAIGVDGFGIIVDGFSDEAVKNFLGRRAVGLDLPAAFRTHTVR